MPSIIWERPYFQAICKQESNMHGYEYISMLNHSVQPTDQRSVLPLEVLEGPLVLLREPPEEWPPWVPEERAQAPRVDIGPGSLPSVV